MAITALPSAMDSVELLRISDEDVLTRLRETVQLAIGKSGSSKSVEHIVNRLKKLIEKFQSLTTAERNRFIQQMQDSFEDTIASIESKLVKQARVEQFLSCSFIGIVVVIVIFALFGYKLYKSLMEKELKKQEKQKNNKKSKKIKQK